MTMHLAQGLTTIKNKKYKPKMTKANIAKWSEGLRVKNKQNKRMGIPKLTFEQYVDYCHGISPRVDPRSREAFKPNRKPVVAPIECHTDKYPSMTMSKAGTGSGGIDMKWEEEKKKISSGYTIAPAYNKGAYQVIGKANIKDIGK
jgi:hypothetical protein